MSIRDIGPLRGSDEGLNHQIVDTFATVAESDYAWTEKIWVCDRQGRRFGAGRLGSRASTTTGV